jgi:hypothetical protein
LSTIFCYLRPKNRSKKLLEILQKNKKKFIAKKTTVRNIPLGVPANKPAHTTNYDGKRLAPIAERDRATFLTVKEAA